MYIDLHILIYNLAFTYVNGKTLYGQISQRNISVLFGSVSFLESVCRLLDGNAGLLAIKKENK